MIGILVYISKGVSGWGLVHYDDVIMMAIASQITSLTIVYSAVYSGAHQRKHQSSASLGTGEFPAQMASNAENVSIWWRHHGILGGCVRVCVGGGRYSQLLTWLWLLMESCTANSPKARGEGGMGQLACKPCCCRYTWKDKYMPIDYPP